MTHAQAQRALAAYHARPVSAAERAEAARLACEREKYARAEIVNATSKEKKK